MEPPKIVLRIGEPCLKISSKTSFQKGYRVAFALKHEEGHIANGHVEQLNGVEPIASIIPTAKDGKYKDAGYQHFKIEGRTNSVYDVLESYLYYMVKPEYIDKVRLKALKAMEQAVRR